MANCDNSVAEEIAAGKEESQLEIKNDQIPLPEVEGAMFFLFCFLNNFEAEVYDLRPDTMEAQILSCLFIYPSFLPYYKKYWADPDTTVMQIAFDEPINLKTSCIGNIYVKALVHFVIITMRKNLSSEDYESYCKKRFKGFYAMMRCLHLSPARTPHISYECMSRMKSFFDKTPKLVSTIFSWVRDNKSLPEFKLAYHFLNFSELRVIKMCYDFLHLDPMEGTVAHKHPRVIAEGEKLKAAIAKIIEAHGPDWGYIRLQRKVPELNCTNFAYLVKAALAYFKHRKPVVGNLKSKFIKTKLFEADVKVSLGFREHTLELVGFTEESRMLINELRAKLKL